MKPYFVIALFILVISVIGALVSGSSFVMLFMFAELASLVSFYMFFSVIIPSLFPEYRDVDENFNCGASEIYLDAGEMYGPKTPFGGMQNK
ncbi:MAG TPA: hypothetical protein VGJ92_08340 [Methanocella sp.]|jgi:ABC-type polysaccharide/polyol phosphate export permease